MSEYVAAIVVTFNRKELLLVCISGLLNLDSTLKNIIIVDNGSTDRSFNTLKQERFFEEPRIAYLLLGTNSGGAGGFCEGIRYAYEKTDCDWFWLMDDDAIPHPDALDRLMAVADDERNLYGSTPVCDKQLSWAVTIQDSNGKRRIEEAASMPDRAEVEFLPFLGLLVHRRLVERIGFPDPGYFIAADDVEYSVRARKTGAKIIQAGRSRIEHPAASTYRINALGKTFYCLKLPPWKRYYDTRNRLLLSRTYFGRRLYTETIPSLLFRLLGALFFEPHKGRQLWAFAAGCIDGLLGIKGPRHEFWHIHH